jgi:hypothetical protein
MVDTMNRPVVKEAERALKAVHADMSVPLETTLYDLECLRDVVLDLISAIKWDIKNSAKDK